MCGLMGVDRGVDVGLGDKTHIYPRLRELAYKELALVAATVKYVIQSNVPLLYKEHYIIY